MWHKQSFTQFWSQSDAYSRRSSLKLTYIHHPLVVCTHQICCAVAVPIALSQDRLLHGHNRLVNWTPCSRMRESKLIKTCLLHTVNTMVTDNMAIQTARASSVMYQPTLPQLFQSMYQKGYRISAKWFLNLSNKTQNVIWFGRPFRWHSSGLH